MEMLTYNIDNMQKAEEAAAIWSIYDNLIADRLVEQCLVEQIA